MVRTRDGQLTQPIGINPMGGMALARPWHPIDRRDAHTPHQGWPPVFVQQRVGQAPRGLNI